MLNYDEIITRSEAHRDLLLTNATQQRLAQSLVASQPHPILAWVGQQLVKWGRQLQSDKQMLALPALLSPFSNRRLVRHGTTSLPLLALLTCWFCLSTRPAAAATILVDGTTCTLVAAIDAANNDATAGGCPAGSGADTITLLNDVLLDTVNNNGDGTGPTGLPPITSTITLQGNGHTIGRASEAPAFRLLYVASNGTLTLTHTTLTAGIAVTFPSQKGGGIYNGGGTLTVSNSTLAYNAAEAGGGGIRNNGVATVSNSTFAHNTSNLFGGGITNAHSKLTVNNSTFAYNTSNLFGGGIFNDGGTLTVNNSTLAHNAATNGGGIANRRAIVTLNRTLIAGNRAPNGREIYNELGTVNSNNYNLIGYDTNAGALDFTPTGSDIVPGVGLALILDTTLADNGGDTQTLALVSGSPAIDAAGDSSLDTDQRGVPRPQGAADDIGAFELSDDNTGPVITPQIDGTLGSNGWYTSNVTVNWRVVDDESTITSQSGCETQNITNDTGGVTFTCRASSGGGTSSRDVTIKRDATAPQVTVTGVSNGASYRLGSAPIAGCSTTDPISEVATHAAVNVTGGNPDGTGSFTATCSGATDKAGNSGSASVTYSVVYPWSGFLQPVDNLPTVNTGNAGQGIPVKFSLGGDFGLNIFASGSPASQNVSCGSGGSSSTDPIEETMTAGNSSLQYDPTTQRYTYVWKTEKAWAGTCRQLIVRLIDGVDHVALFQFNGKGRSAEEGEQAIHIFLPLINQ